MIVSRIPIFSRKTPTPASLIPFSSCRVPLANRSSASIASWLPDGRPPEAVGDQLRALGGPARAERQQTGAVARFGDPFPQLPDPAGGDLEFAAEAGQLFDLAGVPFGGEVGVAQPLQRPDPLHHRRRPDHRPHPGQRRNLALEVFDRAEALGVGDRAFVGDGDDLEGRFEALADSRG